MNQRTFHCSHCGLLGFGVPGDGDLVRCAECREVLVDRPLRDLPKLAGEVAGPGSQAAGASQSSGKRSSKGSQSKASRSGRRRESALAGAPDFNSEQKTANRTVFVAVALILVVGLAFAGYQFFKLKKQQRARESERSLAEVAVSEVPETFFEVKLDREAGAQLEEAALKVLRSFYNSSLSNRRLSLVRDSDEYVTRLEAFYFRNSDKLDPEELTLKSLYQSKVLEPLTWLARCEVSGKERDFVLVLQDNSLLLDWPHMIALGAEEWAEFLKAERPREIELAAYAWLLPSQDSTTYLLRVAAPMFPGAVELAESSPIIRVAKTTEAGRRLQKIFEELPEELNEAGLPRTYADDGEMRQVRVKLRGYGQTQGQAAIELLEVVSGDWLSAGPDERQEWLPEAMEESDSSSEGS